ncbi:uncharacterized protein LOC127740617 isoform X1 [Arachis duranensis]|uniref:Uncharacterized protein LOC127740617 isoform X1 n=1 Tax=Arachis duranensis TaxID=130453 RepID=A0A9C6T0U5_ARADU|nr:uncharacterized protein LOC127740617 isoform X1 [Arachis duranensis]
MDYSDYILSPKLARLQRRFILAEKRAPQRGVAPDRKIPQGWNVSPVLPLKRSSATLTQLTSPSIVINPTTNSEANRKDSSRSDAPLYSNADNASEDAKSAEIGHQQRSPLSNITNVYQSDQVASSSKDITIPNSDCNRQNKHYKDKDPATQCSSNKTTKLSSLHFSIEEQRNFTTELATSQNSSHPRGEITALDRGHHEQGNHDPNTDYNVLDAFDDTGIDSEYVHQHHTADWQDQTQIYPDLSVESITEEDTWDAGDPVHRCLHCNACMWGRERLCKSKRSEIPKFGLCCMNGKVVLPLLKRVPQVLEDLHCGDHDQGRHFRKNIRKYNSMFAFTSMAGKVNRSINNGIAPPNFSISGQNYHSIGSLIPTKNDRPRFAQLYIYDTENEIQSRISAVRSTESTSILESQIVNRLKDMLDTCNPLAKSFRSARDRFSNGKTSEIKLRLIRKRETDGRVYNLPTASEVAILIVGDIDDSILQRDIIIETTSNKLQRIDVLHPLYLALQYPLIFPYGEDGFRPGIETSMQYGLDSTKKRKTISMREFFSFRLQMRVEESPIILQCRRLLQQFLVDAYTMIESERLSFIRHNQPKLRVDKYNALHESLVRGEANAVATGQRIILPSSFTGGPRYMFNNCKDAFAICKYAGYPSFFITITCNPEWDEIKRLLRGTRFKAEDRPDILARIFSIKLGELITDFKQGRFFGKITAYVCTVEFQKRGLPHAHILLFMHPLYKPKSPEDIDKLISAEIPDKLTRPKLYAAVEKFMVHGPCGRYNNNSPYMSNGRCSKYYPKPFRARTIVDEAGFPKYRRSDNGMTIVKKNVVLDNSYVVPYNPSLLLKYGCHINVEHTCQTSAIKYLFKYVHKGNDRVTASFYQTNAEGEIEQVVDEIRNYYDCRYISSCEAAWRIFGYDIQQKEPSVIRLPFHLPNEHPVVFRDYENIVDVTERVDGKLTKFLAWMLANKLYPFGRTLTYSQFPNKFVWKDDVGMWMPRKQGYSIGRLTHVPRGNGEDYYLRLLLNIQKGCLSFVELRTVEGVVYGTFKEACYALGLLQDDKEFIDAIFEVGTWASANYIRDLFVVLLLSNNMGRPEIVWEQCYSVLSEDILFTHRRSLHCLELHLSDEEIMNITLSKIEDKLQANGRSLKEFKGMPYPIMGVLDDIQDRIIMDELNFDLQALKTYLTENLTKMNRD